MSFRKEIGRSIVAFRAKRLQVLRALRGSLADEMRREAEGAGLSLRNMRSPLSVPLLLCFVGIVNAHDKALPDLPLQGLPIIGSAVSSPHSQQHEVPAQMSLLELLATPGRGANASRTRPSRRAAQTAWVEQCSASVRQWRRPLSAGAARQ